MKEMNKMTLYDYVNRMTETQDTLVLIRRNDCLIYKGDDEIPYDFTHMDIEVLAETETLCVVKMADEWKPTTTETPCDWGECPYDAEYSEHCRVYCGLGVDESEIEKE